MSQASLIFAFSHSLVPLSAQDLVTPRKVTAGDAEVPDDDSAAFGQFLVIRGDRR